MTTNKFTFKDRHHSEETKKRLSEINKGKHKKFGSDNHFYGKHHSDETRKKISEILNNGKHPWRGKHHSEETKKKMSINNGKCWLGKKMPKEIRDKISKSHMGHTPWNKGKKNCFSTKTLEKMSKSRTGKRHRWKRHCSEEEKKKISERMKGKNTWNYGKFGDKNNNWKGGTSFLPYCPKFNHTLKEHIRNRDNRTCQLCSIKENGERLSIHHIHYDKENCHPDLITLCRKCNCKVNSRRSYYESLFMNNLNDRGLLFWTTK